jgi:hypothetical protein
MVDCEGEEITARFSRAQQPRLAPEHLSLKNGACADARTYPTFNDIVIVIPFNKCGTTKASNITHIIYHNTVTQNIPPEDPIITRIDPVDNDVNCVMLRNTDPDSNIQNAPQTAPPVFGDGQFDVRMALYPTARFQNPISVFPARVELGSYIYVAVTLVTEDQELKLVVPQCYATPDADPDSQPQYYFIENKCRVESTVTFYPLNETTFAYRFRTFKFQPPYEDYIYVHCRAYVCEVTERTAECDRSCVVASNTRRKRHALLDDKIRVVEVEKGPLVFGDINENDEFHPNQEIIRDINTSSAGVETSNFLYSIIILLLGYYMK